MCVSVAIFAKKVAIFASRPLQQLAESGRHPPILHRTCPATAPDTAPELCARQGKVEEIPLGRDTGSSSSAMMRMRMLGEEETKPHFSCVCVCVCVCVRAKGEIALDEEGLEVASFVCCGVLAS